MGIFKKKDKEKKDKKPFKETKVGVFLKEKAPKILDVIGDILPDKGLFGIAKNLISSDDSLSPDDKAHALKLLEFDMIEAQEISNRWKYDMTSDSWLSKNVRPLVCLYTWVLLTAVFILKWADKDLPNEYITLFTTLALAVNAAYFGARTIEKYHKGKSKD